MEQTQTICSLPSTRYVFTRSDQTFSYHSEIHAESREIRIPSFRTLGQTRCSPGFRNTTRIATSPIIYDSLARTTNPIQIEGPYPAMKIPDISYAIQDLPRNYKPHTIRNALLTQTIFSDIFDPKRYSIEHAIPRKHLTSMKHPILVTPPPVAYGLDWRRLATTL